MAQKYSHFIPQNIAPKGAVGIGVYNENKEKVCVIPLNSRLMPVTKEKLYSFGLVSDIHLYVTNEQGQYINPENGRVASWVDWSPNEKFDSALDVFVNKNCSMCIVCGDLTQTGFYDQYANGSVHFNPAQMVRYQEICNKYKDKIDIYEIAGNHESYYSHPLTEPDNFEKWKECTGKDALFYTVLKENPINEKKDLFIFCGEPNNTDAMGNDDFILLQNTLANNTDKRCFIFIHSYIESDSGDAGNYQTNSIFDTWSKTEDFIALLKQYSANVVLFHGHSHIKFEWQTIDKSANYSEVKKEFKSVHIPSLGKPRDVDAQDVDGDGKYTEDVGAEAQGYIVDVYDDCIVLNGWDFINNIHVPLGTLKIDI